MSVDWINEHPSIVIRSLLRGLPTDQKKKLWVDSRLCVPSTQELEEKRAYRCADEACRGYFATALYLSGNHVQSVGLSSIEPINSSATAESAKHRINALLEENAKRHGPSAIVNICGIYAAASCATAKHVDDVNLRETAYWARETLQALYKLPTEDYAQKLLALVLACCYLR